MDEMTNADGPEPDEPSVPAGTAAAAEGAGPSHAEAGRTAAGAGHTAADHTATDQPAADHAATDQPGAGQLAADQTVVTAVPAAGQRERRRRMEGVQRVVTSRGAGWVVAAALTGAVVGLAVNLATAPGPIVVPAGFQLAGQGRAIVGGPAGPGWTIVGPGSVYAGPGGPVSQAVPNGPAAGRNFTYVMPGAACVVRPGGVSIKLSPGARANFKAVAPARIQAVAPGRVWVKGGPGGVPALLPVPALPPGAKVSLGCMPPFAQAGGILHVKGGPLPGAQVRVPAGSGTS